jgi:hypothetical protein
MKIAALVTAVALAASLAGCGEKPAPAPTPPATPATPATPAAPTTPAGPATPAAPAADAYPLTTCVVSGEKLGGMGDPYVFTYEGTEVRLCCINCKKEFDKDPKACIAKIEAARKK